MTVKIKQRRKFWRELAGEWPRQIVKKSLASKHKQMKKYFAALFLVILFSKPVASALPGAPVPTANSVVIGTTNPPPLQIVTLQAGVDVGAVIHEFNLQPKFIYRHALNGFAAAMDSATIGKLKQDDRIAAVSADAEVFLCSQTMPTGIARMGLTNFPVAHLNGQDHRINVDVAVLDSGIQLDHPDLNVYLPGSVSFADGSTNGSDWKGHGTHVAGIAGALDNDFGVVGVAPGVRLWSIQVVGPNQHEVANLLAGLDYISLHADTISVVNASLTTRASSDFDVIHQAVSNIVSQGVVFVAAAGNELDDLSSDIIWGNEDDNLPAGLPEVMAVSAMNPTNDTFWSFSNYSFIRHDPSFVLSPGFAMDVAAPGVNIFSTYKNSGYTNMTGTSMASPHVAGLVALYIAANGRATNAAGVYKIRQAIVDNSLPQPQWYPNGQPTQITANGPTYLTTTTGDPDSNFEPLAMPSENWVPQPKILTVSPTVPGAQVSFQTVPGYTYTVQYCNSLTVSNQWTDLTATNGTGSLTTVTVSDSTPSTMRFYRLSRQTTP